jgi:Na+-transporting methylmalonyl-CoA/oxaloacetate decarboxylase gamma subunit
LSEPMEPYEMVLLGFFFVLSVLTILTFLTWLVGKILHRPRNKIQRANEKETDDLKLANAAEGQMSSTLADDEDEEDAEDLNELRVYAAISAAIHLVMKDHRFRVRSIRATDHSWAQEGRRQIFSSHRLR